MTPSCSARRIQGSTPMVSPRERPLERRKRTASPDTQRHLRSLDPAGRRRPRTRSSQLRQVIANSILGSRHDQTADFNQSVNDAI